MTIGLATKIIISILLLILAGQAGLAQTTAQKRSNGLDRGVNLSFLDHYWKGSKEKHFSDFLTERDIAPRTAMLSQIASEGFKTVRVPVCFSAWATHKAPFKWRNKAGLKALDKIIAWGLKNDLNVIIDQHHPELDGDVAGAADIERVAWIWRQVAKRYKSTDPERVFFELWNEPHDIKASVWRDHAEKLIKLFEEEIRIAL